LDQFVFTFISANASLCDDNRTVDKNAQLIHPSRKSKMKCSEFLKKHPQCFDLSGLNQISKRPSVSIPSLLDLLISTPFHNTTAEDIKAFIGFGHELSDDGLINKIIAPDSKFTIQDQIENFDLFCHSPKIDFSQLLSSNDKWFLILLMVSNVKLALHLVNQQSLSTETIQICDDNRKETDNNTNNVNISNNNTNTSSNLQHSNQQFSPIPFDIAALFSIHTLDDAHSLIESAVTFNNFPALKLLVENDTIVNYQQTRPTNLILSDLHNSINLTGISEFLFQKGLCTIDHCSQALLNPAIHERDDFYQCIKLLISLGASVNEKRQNCDKTATFLHLIAENHNFINIPELFRLKPELLKQIDVHDKDGYTPLFNAILCPKMLKDDDTQGNDPNNNNDDDNSDYNALECGPYYDESCPFDNDTIIELVQAGSALLGIKNHRHQTILHGPIVSKSLSTRIPIIMELIIDHIDQLDANDFNRDLDSDGAHKTRQCSLCYGSYEENVEDLYDDMSDGDYIVSDDFGGFEEDDFVDSDADDEDDFDFEEDFGNDEDDENQRGNNE
jgi:hypothetical protein